MVARSLRLREVALLSKEGCFDMAESVTRQICKVNAIIDFKDFKEDKVKSCFDPLEKYLQENASVYGFIFHNRDVLESGQLKTYHIHACFSLKKRKRISTIINDLSDACNVSGFAVTVKKMSLAIRRCSMTLSPKISILPQLVCSSLKSIGTLTNRTHARKFASQALPSAL